MPSPQRAHFDWSTEQVLSRPKNPDVNVQGPSPRHSALSHKLKSPAPQVVHLAAAQMSTLEALLCEDELLTAEEEDDETELLTAEEDEEDRHAPNEHCTWPAWQLPATHFAV